MLQSMFRGAVSALVINWQGMPQESAAVPAGRFDGCVRARSEAQWGPWKSTADSWRHPAVPLSGLVRSQGIDHPFTMELVAFGIERRDGRFLERARKLERRGMSCSFPTRFGRRRVSFAAS